MGSTEKPVSNLGNSPTRLNRLESIRTAGENRRIAEEARQQNEAGSRSWNPSEGEKLRNVSAQKG